MNLKAGDFKNSLIWHYFCLVSIFLIAAYLRLKGLTAESYWNDEVATLVLSDPDKKLFHVIIDTLLDKSPPLYQSMLWIWFNQFGFTELSGRLFSAITGIISIPVMYFMAREYTNKETALYASLITALNFYHIFYSQEVRSYALLFLVSTLAYLFLSRLSRHGNAFNLLIFTFITICLVQTHYYGLLVYFALFCFLVVYKSAVNRYLPGHYLLINAFFTFLSLVPVAPFMAINAMDKSTWIKTPSTDFLVDYFSGYFGGYAISVFYAIAFLSGLIFLYKKAGANRKIYVSLIIAILFFVYLFPYYRSLISTPMINERYTIGALPLIILVIASGISMIKQNTLKSLILIMVIMLNIKVLFLDKDYYDSINKQQYRETIWHLVSNLNDIPVYGCDYDRIEAYSKMLGHPVSIDDDDQLFFQLAGNFGPEKFWYIGSTCCGCQDNTEKINRLTKIRGFTLIDQYSRHKSFVYLFADKK